MGSTILITPMHSPLGTVTHMCHDVVPATLSGVGERASSEWAFRSALGGTGPRSYQLTFLPLNHLVRCIRRLEAGCALWHPPPPTKPLLAQTLGS